MGPSTILHDPSAKNDSPNWLHLPQEVMVLILQRMCCYDVLMNVKQVCKSWHTLCNDPFTWQDIEFRCNVLLDKMTPLNVAKMIEHVFDLSCGQTLDLSIFGFASAAGRLLEYISPRSSRLRSLRLHDYDLYISTQNLDSSKFSSPEHIGIICSCCPHLKSLALNNLRVNDNIPDHPICNQLAFAIAKYTPQLCCLELYGNSMTNGGLPAILHNCHNLEYLDIRQCYNIFVLLGPDLMSKARKQIKHLRFSKDRTGVY